MTRLGMFLRIGTVTLLGTTLAGVCSTDPDDSTYALELTTSGVGQGALSIEPGASDTVGTSFFFAPGASVSVTAMPSSGSVFTGWGKASGSDAPPAGCITATNPCLVTMNERKSVVGHFTTSTGVARFDGEYTGTTTKSGNAGTGPLELRITNGAVQGWLTPSGTANTFTGTVNDAGAFSATVAGVGGGCPVTFTGQFTTANSAGIVGASASGTFAYQGQNCGQTGGSWTVTRDQVPVTKTVAPVS
jgi:hypothetical protein